MVGARHRWLGLLVGALLLRASVTVAQPVIPPGQEERVLALLEPHGFGAAPVGGWCLEGVQIERSLVRITVAGPSETATLRLLHPDVSDGAERTASFVLERDGPSDAAKAALDPWVDAVRTNDDGSFWSGMRSEAGRTPAEPSGDPAVGVAPVALLALFLLLGAWERWRLGADPPGAPSTPVGERWHRWAVTVGALGVAAMALAFTATAPPLHPDTNRDLLLARDCLERGICLGPSTSFGGLEQHAGWVRLLALLRAVGLEPAAIHRVLIAANACGVGLLAFVAARRANAMVAVVLAAVSFSWLVWAADFPILWNPTLVPLAYALLYGGVLARRWAIAGTLAGLGAVAAVETHVVGLAATAVLVLGLRTLADRPERAVPLALALFLGLEVVLSGPSIAINLSSPIAARALTVMVVALGAAWLVGGWLRRRFGSRPERELAVLGLTAVGTVGPPMVAALAAGHFLSARYFTIAIVPLVGLFGAALLWLLHRGRGGRVVAVVLVLGAGHQTWGVWSDAAQRQYYDMEEVACLADELAVRERHASVRLALRGPLTNLLGGAFAAWAADGSFEPSIDEPSLSVVRVASADALPEGWRAVSLPSGAVAGISERPSWLRPAVAEVCLIGAAAPECVTLTAESWRAFGGERDSYERLSGVRLPLAERLRERVVDEQPGPLRVFLRIPIRTDGSQPERTLQLFDGLGADGGWRVARVEGVDHRGELGGQRIVLVDGGRGTLTLEHSAPVEHHMPSLLLQALELGPAERPLLDVLCADYPGC